MRQKLDALLERIDQRSARERGLLFATTLTALGVVWYQVLFAPLEEARRARLDQIAELRTDSERVNAEIAVLVAERSRDPDTNARQRLDGIRGRVSAVDAELQAFTRNLVPPKKMASLLRSVLERQSGLRLVSLEGLGAEPVLADARAAAKGVDTQPALETTELRGGSRLYKHGLRIELQGSYLDTLSYLRALEELPWRFLWEQVRYEVDEHPKATISITVYSLSLDPAWIGV